MEEEMKGTLENPVKVMRRALKFASRDAKRPILTAVHLDESGDVVSTDSYRLFAEGAWDGPTMNVDYATAYDISKCKVKGNETAEFELKGGKLAVRMGDGTVINGATVEGKYPDYSKFFEIETRTTAYVKPEQVLPILREHAKGNVRIDVCNRDVVISGASGEPEPAVRFDKACDGEDKLVEVKAAYLKEALQCMGDVAEIRIEASHKPLVVSSGDGTDVLVMPVRLGGTKEPKVKTKKEERVEKKETITVECFGRSFYASHRKGEFITPGGPSERVSFEVGKAYRYREGGHEYAAASLGYDVYKGQKKCLFAVFEGGEWRGYLRTMAWGKLKTLANNPLDEPKQDEPKKLTPPPVKADKPRKQAPKAPAKPKTEEKGNDMEKRIEELEARLKAMSAELEEVWKENAQLKATKPEVKPEPKPEPAEVKAEVVSLETMQQWCEGKGLVASQKREGTCIWVEGDSKEYADELKELGFRFAKKRKSWYLNPAA